MTYTCGVLKQQFALQHASWLLRKAIVKDSSSIFQLQVLIGHVKIPDIKNCSLTQSDHFHSYTKGMNESSDINHGDPVPPSFKSTPRQALKDLVGYLETSH